MVEIKTKHFSTICNHSSTICKEISENNYQYCIKFPETYCCPLLTWCDYIREVLAWKLGLLTANCLQLKLLVGHDLPGECLYWGCASFFELCQLCWSHSLYRTIDIKLLICILYMCIYVLKTVYLSAVIQYIPWYMQMIWALLYFVSYD